MKVIGTLAVLVILLLVVLYYFLRGKRFQPPVPKASVPPRPQETPAPLSELTTVQPKAQEAVEAAAEEQPAPAPAEGLVQEEHPEQLGPVETQVPEQVSEAAGAVEEEAAREEIAKEEIAREETAAEMKEGAAAEVEEGVAEAQMVEAQAAEAPEEASTSEAPVPEAPVPEAPTETVSQAAPARRDPLEKINGIGPVYKRRLYEAGVYTFQQLAALSPEQIREIIQPKSWQKIEPESWIQQARELAAAQDEAAS